MHDSPSVLRIMNKKFTIYFRGELTYWKFKEIDKTYTHPPTDDDDPGVTHYKYAWISSWYDDVGAKDINEYETIEDLNEKIKEKVGVKNLQELEELIQFYNDNCAAQGFNTLEEAFEYRKQLCI